MNDAAQQPLVSILIRSMDRPTLQRALRSAASQTWPNLEIVVVAACGTTHRDLGDSYENRPLRLVYPGPDRHLSRPEAANLALQAARGEWVNFLDDDDELLPHHLSTLMSAAQSGRERVVFAATRVVDENGKLLGHVSHAGNHVQLYFHSRSTTCGMLLHRSLIDEGVRFDGNFNVHEDHDFQVACATRTEFRFVEAATCIWHSQIGDSGCGFGSNDDAAQRREAVAKVRHKWAKFFEHLSVDFDAFLFTGQMYLRGRDYRSACECLEHALALRPRDVNALNLCGMANYHRGHLQRAQALVARALQILPNHRALRENLELIDARISAERQSRSES